MLDRLHIEATISEATGSAFSIESTQSLSGGCINAAFRVEGATGAYFVKSNDPSFADAFSAEIQGLRELHATQTIRVPQPIAQTLFDARSYLILEYIETSCARDGDWAALGRNLAKLHREPKDRFGWHRDNLIGATDQPNLWSDHWIEFFRIQRLEHQFRLCHRKGYSFPDGARLLDRLPSFFENYQPFPSLLHGDLWSGNAAFASDGEPFIFDPATYYGDRETEIAFTEFFGGFAPTFYEAYRQELPLDSGYALRKDLYNLYHCLNHAYLFGPSYARQAEQMIRQLLHHA